MTKEIIYLGPEIPWPPGRKSLFDGFTIEDCREIADSQGHRKFTTRLEPGGHWLTYRLVDCADADAPEARDASDS